MNLEKIFQIAAVLLIGVAAFFLWQGSGDGVFVAAVGGAVCFFLSIRFQVGERMKQRKDVPPAAADDGESATENDD